MVASVKRLRIAAATVEYFEADGYYARGDPEHRRASRWYGAAAAHCGLRNHTVTARAFAAVLEGYVPRTDLRLGRLRDGEHQHLPGVDITFSAPKSISVEGLVYAPPHTRARLRNAHDGAVRAALDFLERELLQTRGYDRATRRRPRVPAHGLLAALFRHITNRNLDPQLHTHCVLANMTRNAAGAWRSAEFTAAFRAKKLLGAYYRAELQRRVEAIGYATVPTLVGTVPGFEIAGYPKALLEAFSTRRRDLLEWLEARGLAYTPANAQQAVLATRRRKAAPDRAALPALWRRRAAECARARDPRAVRRRGTPVPPAPSPLELARRSVEHLAERSTLFTAHDLRGYALAYGGGRQTLPAIDAALAALERDRLLLAVPADGVDRAYTTRGAAAAEREVLRRLRDGHGAGRVLAEPGRVADALAASPLNAGQRAAVTTVLLTPHRVVGVQGYAGTGKTTMLREVARLAATTPLLGLAPSTGAARVLGREAGIPTRTLQWFLVRHGDVADGTADDARLADARAAHGGGLLVVDEASMIGTTAMVRLLRIAARAGVARVVLVGDRAQLRAVEAGQPFRLLQRAGMPTARMTEVLRQRNPSLRAAVRHLIAERPALAIEELGPGVLEVGGGADPDADLAATMADLWLALDPAARARTLLLAPTHALRAEVHGLIRRRLADEGVLRGTALRLDRYVNLRLTHAQKRELVHYREGDVLVFHQRDYGVGVEAGDACHVLGTDGERVLLDTPAGRVRRMDPDRRVRYRFELYETRTIELRAGDRIRWTRPHRGGGLELDNGARATVRGIGRRQVRFRADDGAAYALARADPQLHHLDHAYTSTVHGAQGLTADSVIAILRADHGPLTDLTTAYVELSRARDDAVLLTDDREALGAALDQRSGEECSALEALGVDLPDPEAAPRAIPPAWLPPPPPPPIGERPPLWSEAVHWWAFADAARAKGEEPFAAAGAGAAVAPVLARAAETTDSLPAGIARVVDQHRAWRRQEERERREAEAAEARRRRLKEAARALEAAAMRLRLGAAARQLQAAMPRKFRAVAHAWREAAARLEAALGRRLVTLLEGRRRANAHLLRLAEREGRALADWRQRRCDLVAATVRHPTLDAPPGRYERTAAEGRRLLPPLIRRLEAADHPGLPARILAVRRDSRAVARSLEATLLYDAEAAALTEQLRERRHGMDDDRERPWFAGVVGAELGAGIERLAEKAASPALAPLVVLPPALASARREHRQAVRRLTVALRVVARLTAVGEARRKGLAAAACAGSWFQTDEAYGPWRQEAEATLRLTEKMERAAARYAPLVRARTTAAPGFGAVTGLRPPPQSPGLVGWEAVRLEARELRRALLGDEAARELERTYRSLVRRSRLPGARIPYYRKDYPAFIERLEALARSARPGELPPALGPVLEEHRTQAWLHRTVAGFITGDLPRLETLPGLRRALRGTGAKALNHVLDREPHVAWSGEAEALTAAAQELLDGPQYAPHLRAARGATRRIRRALDPVRRQLADDREAQAVLRDWRTLAARARQWRPPASAADGPAPGRSPFFEDGYDPLIARVRVVHDRTRDDEPVPEFVAALRDHEALAANRRDVDRLLARLRARSAERRRLLQSAARNPAPFRSAYPRQHAEWETLGTEAQQASGALVARITEYEPHLRRDPRGWPDLVHSRFEAFASEGLGGLAAAHLLRLHDHGATCAGQGEDPWAAVEMYAMQSAMRGSLSAGPGRSSDPAAEDERRRTWNALEALSNQHEVRTLPEVLAGLAQKRGSLEADAAARGCAVVDLPAWKQWHGDAELIAERTRKLLKDPGCRGFLERWPDHARRLREALPPLEARQREDEQNLQARERQQARERARSNRARRGRQRWRQPKRDGPER